MKKLIALMLSLTLLLTCTGTINAGSSTKTNHILGVYRFLSETKYESQGTHTVYCPHHGQDETCEKTVKMRRAVMQCIRPNCRKRFYEDDAVKHFENVRLTHDHPDCDIEDTIYPIKWSPYSPYAPQPIDNGTIITD